MTLRGEGCIMTRWAMLLAAFLELSVLPGCSSAQSRPDPAFDKTSRAYVEARCSNGARIRTLNAQFEADYAVGNTKKADAESLALDREFIICSENTNDAWIEQVTNLWGVFDSRIDENTCHNEWNAAQSGGDMEWSALFACEMESARGRVKTIQDIIRDTSFADVRAYGKKLEGAAIEDYKVDNAQYGAHVPDFVRKSMEKDAPTPLP